MMCGKISLNDRYINVMSKKIAIGSAAVALLGASWAGTTWYSSQQFEPMYQNSKDTNAYVEMAKTSQINGLRNWGIQFDAEGRIVATQETMSDILHVLLDHRLRSELSDNQYDVPSTTPVGN